MKSAKYPLGELAVGASLTILCDPDESPSLVAKRLSHAANQYRTRHGVSFAVRTDQQARTVTIWRIA